MVHCKHHTLISSLLLAVKLFSACCIPYQTDFVGNSLADWCDENTMIVCDIFDDEVLKGNRSSTHLSKTSYKNVIERFKDRTGIDYTRKQFKNKWDKCKQDYDIRKRLTTKDTGIGWDESKNNIVMTEAWWKKAAQVSYLTCNMTNDCSSRYNF
jgi:hypothetical protein